MGMKHLANRISACLGLLLLMWGLALPGWCVTTGTSDLPVQGTAGDSDKGPFTLLSCSLSPDQNDVATNVLIQLDFDRNVVNVSVLEHNLTCFHLADPDGNSVAIQVTFPDDQLQQKNKRTVFLQPVESLAPLTRYVLAVDNCLLAKNGTHIDQAYNVSFVTGTEEQPQENALLESLGDYVRTYETDLPMTEQSIAGSLYEENAAYTAAYDSYAKQLPPPETAAAAVAALALALAACVTVGLLWTRRRHV